MVELLPRDPNQLAASLLGERGRLLLFGAAGAGKSYLAASLADACAAPCTLINANVGSPALGPPGCVWRARRHERQWQIEELEALCTLDAGRFRLPLSVAVARILESAPDGPVLIEAPGVSHAPLAYELLLGLAAAARADAILILRREADDVRELLGHRTVAVPAATEAAGTSKPVRAETRTLLWDRYLDGARTIALAMPAAAGPLLPEECDGAQVGLLDSSGRTLALGEIEGASEAELLVRAPLDDPKAVHAYLVRDARRNDAGMLTTASAVRSPSRGRAEIELQPDSTSDMVAARDDDADVNTAPISAHVASARVVLVNGLFGDPTLHLRFRHHRRSLLFDVGETARLQARIAHQISDLFVSHAHVDHIAGFLWLLRSRIGIPEPCRVLGPPGMADRVGGMLTAIEWDRAGDRAPVFEVSELDGDRATTWRLRAGDPRDTAPTTRVVPSGVVLEEPGFRIRVATLTHGNIPSLAFAVEESVHLNVRKERLAELAVEPGPWLETLKHRVHAGEDDRPVELPDGTRRSAGELATLLLLERAGEKVVYATDFGDTPENRQALVHLARGAHTLFCEASFVADDADQARATGHLTATACAEIATAAGVGQLIPFHLSRRYESEPERVLAEVCRRFPATFVPPSLRATVAEQLNRGA